ncbi:hypothetical protein GCM10011321_09240 [Youhaiella tibetensis]|uniref:Uncharacterized protein n=1 Tax=Paradevosia tibetensis TaxID=1447062 RepID=A0A5B9DR44_9HYPH|nr:hypothetical protein [Youhaiella tibetensis]QEE20918.1 hypothetical protein FNA67_12345 [Youhaiella tibetensis]GGF19894.1 hypothetical protein GCM10011321_09240 [Youhaiella tibetensis]
MTDLKIRVFRGDERHLATTVTIPGGILGIAVRLIPRRALSALRDEGIEVDELVRLSNDPAARGDLVRIEDHDKNELVVISLE